MKRKNNKFELDLHGKPSIPARASMRGNCENFGSVIGNAELTSLGLARADGEREQIF